MAAKRPNAPSFPMFAVSIAAPFAKTVNERSPSGSRRIQGTACLADNVAKPEVDRLNVGVDPRAAGWLKGVEQTIGMRDWVEQCSAWGSIGFFLVHWARIAQYPPFLNKIKVDVGTLFGRAQVLF